MLFKELDKLTLDSSLAALPTHDFQVSLTTFGEVIAAEFQKHSELPGVLITDENHLVGMISRTQFFEWLSRPYGLETFLRRPIQSLWKMIVKAEETSNRETLVTKYLLLSKTCSIDTAIELALNRPASLLYEPIAIAWDDEQHRLLDMQVLLLAHSKLFALAKQGADSADRAKSEFLTNMSQELRTPLNAILGFTQVISRELRRDNLTSLKDLQQYVGIINYAGEHLLELVNDILQLSKLEIEKITLNPKSFDLYYFLDNIKEILEIQALPKGLKLVFDYTSDVPQYICSDEGKLRKILINIIENAIKFTSNGHVILKVKNQSSPVKVEGEESHQFLFENCLYFEVEDTGAGIAQNEINTLFTTFGKTETGRNSQQGIGLGLAISQNFVQLMGGEITVSSTVGRGTTFAFDIQVMLAHKSEVQTFSEIRKVIGLVPNQLNYRILVVDDIPESSLLLVKLLTALGFCTREAENGQEAIKLWSSYSPHLILMDMRMPKMDGYEATKLIRGLEKRRRHDSMSQTTVIIGLTASAFEEDLPEVLSAGCDDFIRKPFREEVLLEKIAQYLGVQYLYEQSALFENQISTEL